MQSCRVQSEGVKNESKGLQETGVPARRLPARNNGIRLSLLCCSPRSTLSESVFDLGTSSPANVITAYFYTCILPFS